VRTLNPALAVIAPVQEWGMARSEVLEYARTRRLRLPATLEGPCRIDTNLWGRTVECGASDPWSEPRDAVYALTKAPADCPGEAAYVEVSFERGVPTAINGVAMPLVELVASLGTIAGAHGVGRIDMVEARPGGASVREIGEAPAAVVLHRAHRELQRLVTTRDADRFARLVSLRYADLVDEGLWFTPLRDALAAFVASVQERVTGAVRLKLFKGDCHVAGRRSPLALYDRAPRAYDAGDAFEHDAPAAGDFPAAGRTARRT
jgi:argininosuccinate synthase